MKNQDLIEELAKHDPELEVYFPNYDYSCLDRADAVTYIRAHKSGYNILEAHDDREDAWLALLITEVPTQDELGPNAKLHF